MGIVHGKETINFIADHFGEKGFRTCKFTRRPELRSHEVRHMGHTLRAHVIIERPHQKVHVAHLYGDKCQGPVGILGIHKSQIYVTRGNHSTSATSIVMQERYVTPGVCPLGKTNFYTNNYLKHRRVKS
jgi:hypothetical protein